MINKIIYWASTGLLTLLMLFSVYNYFFNNEMVVGFFENFGYPIYLVYPLAIAKLLGLVAIWTRFSNWLTEWAYAGFAYNTILAIFAHVMISDGGQGGAIAGLVFTLASYFTGKVVRK